MRLLISTQASPKLSNFKYLFFFKRSRISNDPLTLFPTSSPSVYSSKEIHSGFQSMTSIEFTLVSITSYLFDANHLNSFLIYLSSSVIRFFFFFLRESAGAYSDVGVGQEGAGKRKES